MTPLRRSGSERGEGYDGNRQYLDDELARAEWLVRAHLVRFQFAVPESQRAQYWHLTDADIARLVEAQLDPVDRDPAAWASALRGPLEEVAKRRALIDARVERTQPGVELRLKLLAGEFGLSGKECDLLLLAALPSLHSRYRRLYGILQLDSARWQPSAGLLAEMLAHVAEPSGDRLRMLHPSAPLISNRLLEMDAGATTPDALAGRAVAAADRVVAYLLGDDAVDRRLEGVFSWGGTPRAWEALALPRRITTRLQMLAPLRAADPERYESLRLLFSGPDSCAASQVFAALGRDLVEQEGGESAVPVLQVDLGAMLERDLPWEETIGAACREARLAGALLLFHGAEPLLAEDRPATQWNSLIAALRHLTRPAAIEVGLSGATSGRILDVDAIHFNLPLPDAALRRRVWAYHLRAVESSEIAEPDDVAERLAAAFQLTACQIGEAVRMARNLARRRNVFSETLAADDLFEACRRQSSRRIVAFSQRIEPSKKLEIDDVVLPESNRRQLDELRTRILHHRRVLEESGLGERMRLGRGILALFVGGSGTGKTMAAEVLASQREVDLYKVDLAAVASKWVGETEKNLSRIFADAESSNGMLFFDEADALFGKRGEVKEARDRWANLEVNYLLQRVEEFSGIVIMATNLRQNIDEAFLRRIHVVVEFPQPDAAARFRIWRMLIPAPPASSITDAELHAVSSRFEMAGGSIRNVVLDALYRAYGAGAPLGLRHLIASMGREYQKIQRPITRGEFGEPWYQWAMEDVVAPRAPAPVATAG